MDVARWLFSRWTWAVGTFVAAPIALMGALVWRWPDAALDGAVGAAFALALPPTLNALTFGWARRGFTALRYQPAWLAPFALAWTALVAHLTHAPPRVPEAQAACAALALLTAAGLACAEVMAARGGRVKSA